MGITTSERHMMLDTIVQADKTCEYVCHLPYSHQDHTEGGSSSFATQELLLQVVSSNVLHSAETPHWNKYEGL